MILNRQITSNDGLGIDETLPDYSEDGLGINVSARFSLRFTNQRNEAFDAIYANHFRK